MFNVLTIARQYGSRGSDIGRKVAELPGWECVDKQIIERVAAMGKVEPSWAEQADEHALAEDTGGYCVNRFIFNYLGMVEAAGVEPASETTFNREHSCFSAFIFVSSSTLGTGEDTSTTSLIDLACSAQTEQFRPAYCATIGLRP